MAHIEDEEVMKLRRANADLRQKNIALCAMLRDAIHLADLAIKLGAGNSAAERKRLPGKACPRNGPFRGMSAKPRQV